MVFIKLKQQAYKEIAMKIDLKENEELELESKFSFNVNYNEDNSMCAACLRQEITQKDNTEKFNILVESLGSFECDGIKTDEDKKAAHIQAYTLLFPYVQNMIAQLTVAAGLPPLMVEMEQLKTDKVIVQGS